MPSKVAEQGVLDVLLLGEGLQRGGMIGADTHDLGAGGLELRQGRIEAANLLRSGVCESLDERVEDDGTLRGQLR